MGINGYNLAMSTLSPNERARIRARSGCAEESIKRYPDNREATRLRIERAAREEGIALTAAVASTATASRAP